MISTGVVEVGAGAGRALLARWEFELPISGEKVGESKGYGKVEDCQEALSHPQRVKADGWDLEGLVQSLQEGGGGAGGHRRG